MPPKAASHCHRQQVVLLAIPVVTGKWSSLVHERLQQRCRTNHDFTLAIVGLHWMHQSHFARHVMDRVSKQLFKTNLAFTRLQV